MVDEADNLVKGYGASFDKVKQFRTDRDRLANDILNTNGPQMERNLTKILVSAERDNDMEAAYRSGLALRSLLLARLYVMKFLNDNSQASVDRVNKEAQDLNAELEALDRSLKNPTRRQLLGEIKELETAYLGAFADVTKIIFERNSVIRDSLDAIGPNIAKSVEDVKLSVMTDQDELGPPAPGSQ